MKNVSGLQIFPRDPAVYGCVVILKWNQYYKNTTPKNYKVIIFSELSIFIPNIKAQRPIPKYQQP